MAVMDMLEYVNDLNPATSIVGGNQTLITQSGEVKRIDLDVIIHQYLTVKNVFSDASSGVTTVNLADYVGFTDIRVWKTDVTANEVYISDSRGYLINDEDTKILNSSNDCLHVIMNPITNKWYLESGTTVEVIDIFQSAASVDIYIDISKYKHVRIYRTDATANNFYIIDSSGNTVKGQVSTSIAPTFGLSEQGEMIEFVLNSGNWW